MTDGPIDYDMYQILAMYANGIEVADIGDRFHVTTNTIYSWMKRHPEAYDEAKGKLAQLRNSKYRRAGALAIDHQLKYLENMEDEDLSDEMNTIIKIGETAEKRADLNEGKATEITESRGVGFTIQMPEDFKGDNIK